MRVTALALRELDADDGRAERLRMRDPLCRPHDLAVGSQHAALRERELQRTRLRQRLERRRWPSPWIRCDLDRGALVDAVRNSFEEAVEPRAHLECDVRELIRWIFRGRVTEVADVETLRAADALVRPDCLVRVERKVPPPLQHERRNANGSELRPRRP